MMEQRTLGRSGIKVSRLGFGTLTMASAQANLTAEAGGELLAYAFGQGITFWDTAEIYGNYAHLRAGLKRLGQLPVICTKTYAYDRATAAKSLEKARRALDLDVIDIFLLHEQETHMTMDGHREAFSYLLEQKDKGTIRAVGLSTHAVEPVLALAAAKDKTGSASRQAVWEDIDPGPYSQADIVHPLLNLQGIGLLDGKASDMVQACQAAHQAGIGIFGMKMLGGGHLLSRFDEAVSFALGLPFADAYAVGMQAVDEVDMNVALFEDRPVDPVLLESTRKRRRHLVIGDWCIGCGDCVRRCGEKALSLKDGRVVVDDRRCILCSYCATVCRDFVIKVV